MTRNPRRGFASDNNAGTHPAILNALCRVNAGHTVAYGDDQYTETALAKFKQHFGDTVAVFFVFNGTAANVLSIKAGARSHQAVICAESAHINQDECGAPENYTGCKLLGVPSPDGRLTPQGIETHLHSFGFEHHVQPQIVSITQATELGTVYHPGEIEAICACAHDHGLLVHMDGARLANAAVFLNTGLKAVTGRLGVDVLSFGGVKNGMMFGEAVVFFNPDLAREFKYIRKQAMQLNSKMRFIAAQFDALLSNDLWRRNAAHANAMAQRLAERVGNLPGVTITQPVEANGVFARLPQRIIAPLQAHTSFYVWDKADNIVRWMTSFDTTAEDIDTFARQVETTLKQLNK